MITYYHAKVNSKSDKIFARKAGIGKYSGNNEGLSEKRYLVRFAHVFKNAVPFQYLHHRFRYLRFLAKLFLQLRDCLRRFGYRLAAASPSPGSELKGIRIAPFSAKYLSSDLYKSTGRNFILLATLAYKLESGVKFVFPRWRCCLSFRYLPSPLNGAAARPAISPSNLPSCRRKAA